MPPRRAHRWGGADVEGGEVKALHPWKPNHATKRFIRACREARLEHFRLHDLRHFMATEMLAAGVPIATVSQRLSHARCSTTHNVYAHAIPGGDEAAAETLASILAGAGNELRADGARRHLAPADQTP